MLTTIPPILDIPLILNRYIFWNIKQLSLNSVMELVYRFYKSKIFLFKEAYPD